MGKIIKSTHGEISFWCREGTSDQKAFDEVVVRDNYQKRGITIQSGEHWLDLGGNVGAFSVLAAKLGAIVDVYEPDPNNCKMIEMNLKENGLNANVHQKAVVGSNDKTSFLSISKTKQYWRNSLVKDWKGGFIKVDCVKFDEIITPNDCVKMDIEGSEMAVLENWEAKSALAKLVFEWSFDMDADIDRYRNVVSKMRNHFAVVKADSINEKHKIWQNSWFPPCKNVYCHQ